MISLLNNLCRAHPTRAKWVFVPSHAIGRALGERLAREGCNWVNLRFVTPLDIALRMGAPFLVERDIDPSEEGLGPALVMRLLLELPEEGGYFRTLGDQPTLAQALWTTLRELRMAGVTADQLQPEAFASRAKFEELRALLAAYERFLDTERRGDMAVVYAEALKHPDWCPIQAADCWTELPDIVWSPLQRQLIDAMPGERIAAPAIDLPGATRPRRLAGSGSQPDATRSGGASDPPLGGGVGGGGAQGGSEDPPLRHLMAPQLATGAAPEIDLFHAGGREAEIDEVFRRILHAGAPLDDIEIACETGDHAPLVWEKALRLDWPVTIGPGVPAAFTRPGRALLAFCEWIESGFYASNLRRLLQSGDVRLEVEDLTPGQGARLLVKAEAAWGRATYGLALGRLAKSYHAAAINADLPDEVRASAAVKATRCERLRAWIDRLLQSVPLESGDGNVALQECVASALDFLAACAARANAIDAAAAAALVDAVSELRALGPFRCRLATALRFIRERVEGQSVAADRARPGHLYVSTLSQSGYAGRRLLFVVGLEEGRVFPAAAEDPVLLDSERAAISPALRLSGDRVDEAVWSALQRLASHAGSVVLSYSSRDTREYRETYASWLMLQAFRVKCGDASKSYADLHRALGEAASRVPGSPERAVTDAAWWLAAIKPAGETAARDVLRQFPSVARGREAEAHRESPDFTAYDGHVPEAGKALDPCAIEHGLSPTSLEEAAECGFRHFLKRGLRLDAIDTGGRDDDVWLDPLTRGAELHDLYASALRRCRDANRRPDLATDLPWLLDTARARLDALRIEMPPPSDEVFERESRELLADLELFLEEESLAPTSRTPVGFEVAFGRTYGHETESVEPLAQREPVEIDLGGGLRFRITGRIDRIDQVGPASFEVVDYKTGSFYAPKWASGIFSGGTRLQHALYGIAATELLKRKYKNPNVSAGVYYFPSAKGGKERRVIPTPSTSKIAALLADLRGMIAAGAFAHTNREEDCRFCDFGRACGAPAAVGRVESKLDDKRLALRVRLAAHE